MNWKLLISNLSYLTIVQILSLVLPFFTIPYLLSILGEEKYGLVIYAQASAEFCLITINFGFNIYGTKEIALHKQNIKAISLIVNTIFKIKLLLYLLCLIIFLILIIKIPIFNDHKLLFLFSMGMCINEVFFATWFFQGIEKMKSITLIVSFSKILSVILIFLLIDNEDQYYLVPAFYFLGNIIASIYSLFLIYGKYNIKMFFPKKSFLINTIRNSLPFYISRLSSVVNSRVGILLIGNSIGTQAVSYFDIADKIVKLFLIPYGLINQTVYPSISISKNMNFLKKILVFNFVSSIVIIFGILLFGDIIIRILGIKTNYEISYNILLILMMIIPLNSISIFLGNTCLVVFGKNKIFNTSVIYSSIINIFILFLLYSIGKIELYTIAIVFVFVELFLFLYRVYYVKKYNLI